MARRFRRCKNVPASCKYSSRIMHRMPRNLPFFSFYLPSSFFSSFFIYFLATAPPSELIIDHDIVSFFVHLDPFAFGISTLVLSVCNNKIGSFTTRTWFSHRSKHFSSLCRVLWLRSKEWIHVCLFVRCGLVQICICT